MGWSHAKADPGKWDPMIPEMSEVLPWSMCWPDQLMLHGVETVVDHPGGTGLAMFAS